MEDQVILSVVGTQGSVAERVNRAEAVVRATRQRKLVRFLVASDFLSLSTAAVLALAITSQFSKSMDTALVWFGSTVGLTALMLGFYKLYERDRQQIAVSTLDEVLDFFHALTLVSFVELCLGQTLSIGAFDEIGATTIFIFWLVALGLLPTFRGALRHFVVPHLNTPQNAVIVGAGFVGQSLAMKIRKHPEYNLRIVGFLDDDPHPLDDALNDLPVIAGEEELLSVIRRYKISRVVLAFSKRSPQYVLDVIRSAGLEDVHISIVPRYFELVAGNAGMGDVEGIPVLELPAPGLSRLARFTKRTMDLALTVPGLLLLAPVFGIVAVAIKIDSRGPVFFRQLRMGRDHETFSIYKFRTMVDGAESMRDDLLEHNEYEAGPLFKIKSDPRVTGVGAILRKLSLDELPQLLNVVKGEMSLVGPRPFVIHEDEKIDGWARRRLNLTPGITGVWQVLGRNDIPFSEMVKLDYLYVTNWSLWWDIKLLLRTVPIVFTRRGY
jgi:exopolysaccharide biosynthesis polyprenyl glycosylphosphotransferase